MASVAGQRRGLWRSRWAAIGAAVAVTLGGGGMVAVNAASSAPSSVVTIDPVRILDTRDPVNIGLPGPFVSAVSQKLKVTGGAVPAGATGVLLNVTAVGPTANGFLSVRPGDASGAPSTSSLNFNAGSVVPNSVQVGLPTVGANAGQIDITYDAYGVAGPTTEVLIDVVGYMVAGGGGATGATGPSGPAGPAGVAGPGAQLVDVSVAQVGRIDEIGTFEGVRILAYCQTNQTYLQFETDGDNLRAGGIALEGSVPKMIDVRGVTQVSISSLSGGAAHYSGLVENLTVRNSLQVELHMSFANPCRVWGSIIPVR